MQKPSRIAIFASGNGSNAEAIVGYFKDHDSIQVSLILTNNPQAFVLQRAERLGIRSISFNREQFVKGEVILSALKSYQITHIVLAGFLWLIPAYLLKAFPNRIINIHPALLPKYGGKGMYGLKVHEAVKIAGDKQTGITIHLVNENYDEGKILFQGSCEIASHYSPQEIAECVHKLEYENYPRVIEGWIQNDDQPIS